jgi:hypothetical protein
VAKGGGKDYTRQTAKIAKISLSEHNSCFWLQVETDVSVFWGTLELLDSPYFGPLCFGLIWT